MPGPLPAVPKVVRVDHHYQYSHTANIQTREFFSYTGTLSNADAITWLAAIATAMGVLVNARCSTGYQLYKTELTDLSSTVSPQDINSTTRAGTDVANQIAAGTAFVISKKVVRRFRGGHCRTYLCGWTDSQLINSTQWDPTQAAANLAAFETYISSCVSATPATAGTGAHVMVSYFHGFTTFTPPSGRVKIVPTPRVTPIVDPIINYSYNTTPASQRRRNETP